MKSSVVIGKQKNSFAFFFSFCPFGVLFCVCVDERENSVCFMVFENFAGIMCFWLREMWVKKDFSGRNLVEIMVILG